MAAVASNRSPQYTDADGVVQEQNRPPQADNLPQVDNHEGDDINKSSGISGWYSRQLVKLPVAIAMCIGLLILTAVCGAISLLAFDAPDFSQPTKGFEARGTEVNARMLSFFNIYKENVLSSIYIVNSSNATSIGEKALRNDITNDGLGRDRRDATRGDDAVGRNRRDATQGDEFTSGVQLCQIDWITGGDAFNPPAMVFETVGSNDLFSRQAFISICNHDEAIRKTRPMQENCCMRGSTCSHSWSLGNYVALFNARQTCQDIQDEDVERFRKLLESCAPYYQRKALKYCLEDPLQCPPDVPPECLDHGHAVYLIFHYLVPSKFVENVDSANYELTSTILYLPFWGYYRELYEEAIQGNDVDDGVTSLVALGFGLLKFDLFSDYLLSDTLYIGLGAGLVFLIIWIYTCSLFITIMTILSMLMSLVMAYFAFVVIFRLPFFPFVNVASAVLIIGVGADDTFVYVDIWCQTKSAHSRAHRSLILRETLQHASVTMFVTSFTTASALYSSIVNSITAVRCFGVYAGTAVIINFILTLTWLPAVVVIHSRYQDWCATLTSSSLGSVIRKLHAAVAGVYRRFFQQCLPVVVFKLRYVWIVILASIGAGAFCVVYVTPKLRLPTSAEFQVFRDNDLFELYDKVYKPNFYFSVDGADPLFISAVFGVDAVDNGNHWDPNDDGTLTLLDDFNMFHPDSQKWLLEFCREFRDQSFYARGTDAAPCYMDRFKAVMEAPCNGATGPASLCCEQTDFPYTADIFETCLRAYGTCDVATSPNCQYYTIPGPLFSTEDGSVKAFFLQGISSRKETMEYKYIHDFWTEANDWLDGKLETKPTGIKGGWIYAGSPNGQQLYFYNLQSSLSADTPVSMGLSLALAAVVLLLTTWNILISLYAMMSIAGAFCVTVGTLVLLDWRLNIFESAILTLAVGLSVDFTIHYGVAYRLATSRTRQERALKSLTTVGSAITVAALSTFVAGAMMMPSSVITYVQLGIFLMLVMAVSWVYATFFFLSLCRVIGPQDRCAQVPFPTCCLSRTGPGQQRNVSPVTTNQDAALGDDVTQGATMISYKSTENGAVPDNKATMSTINQTNPNEMDMRV